MITEKVGNLLESPVDVCLHQTNLYHTFGAGIALQIKKKFPEAYEADLKTPYGDVNKLGTYSIGKITNPTGQIKRVVNLYSQVGIGGQDRNTSYDAMVRGLETLHAALEDITVNKGIPYKLGIPWKMGCGLANGNYIIVRAIIESIFAKSSVEVFIYQRPEDVGT